MALVRRDTDQFHPFQDEMSRLFDDFLTNPFLSRPRAVHGKAQWLPALEVKESAEAITINAELPGIAGDDVEVQIDDDVLTLRGHKRAVARQEGENTHHVERRYGAFVRQLRLPTPVDTERTEATMSKGVLTLTLPKIEPKRGRKIRVSTAD